jgi:hypothetical protein
VVQIEQYEAEMEQMSSGSKKKKKTPTEEVRFAGCLDDGALLR